MNERSSHVAPDPAAVQQQLVRILESPHFRNSRRCSDFLRTVVEASASGRPDELKERSLGVAIFQRKPDYDTNQDPIVRNTAGQVRKRLAQYYVSAGHEAEIRIDLPPGSYVPEISPSPATAAAHTEAETEPEAKIQEEPESLPAPAAGKRWRLLGAAALLLTTAVVILVAMRRSGPALDAFWAPVLRSAGPVTLSVGQGHTYKLDEAWDNYFEGRAGEGPPEPRPGDAIPVETVVPSWDRYVGISDAQAAMRLGTLFARYGKEVALRGGRNTSLGDLRRKPVVLVGAFNNEWTLRLTGELRFYFDTDGGKFFVRDRLHPENHAWQVESDPRNPTVQTDYAIVSRVYNPTTEQAVVVAGGIKGGGTIAAGEFLTNPEYMKQALAGAPAGWKNRNVQFVLSTRMYSGTPGPPQVVAAHFW